MDLRHGDRFGSSTVSHLVTAIVILLHGGMQLVLMGFVAFQDILVFKSFFAIHAFASSRYVGSLSVLGSALQLQQALEQSVKGLPV